MAYARKPEILEPEVLPPETNDRRLPPGDAPGRLTWIFIGMTLDLLDLVSLGPVGLKIGFPIGALAGYALFSLLQLPPKRRLLYSIAAGIYCAVPATAPLPLGTLLALLMKLPRNKKK
jgi:hypothetical protein